MFEKTIYNRRGFLKAVAAASCVGVISSPYLAKAAYDIPDTHFIKLYHAEADEAFQGVYADENGYITEAMMRIDHLLRDHNMDSTIPMDVRVIDLLSRIGKKFHQSALEITSGYRTPETNKILRRYNENASINSMHMYGMAVDFKIPKVSSKLLAKAARSVGAGGIGTYGYQSFIHVDVGSIRSWHR